MTFIQLHYLAGILTPPRAQQRFQTPAGFNTKLMHGLVHNELGIKDNAQNLERLDTKEIAVQDM